MGIRTVESLRKDLIRQEDTIIFNLIERAKYPTNTYLYQRDTCPDLPGSIFHFLFKENEALQAKYHLDSTDKKRTMSAFMVKGLFGCGFRENEALQPKVGRYESPEENPFFPEDLPPSIGPPYDYQQVLYPAGAVININKIISDMYFDQLLPLFVVEGNDGNYIPTGNCDIQCLQALSKRIHYGKFVAEVKYLESPDDYRPLILAQDREALMKLLTFETVEEMVKKRVEKKTRTFGQEVSLDDDVKNEPENYKINPLIVSRLYGEWVMPLTKFVQVEYLLRRLD